MDKYGRAIELALKAREFSYSPYSKFRVGCCIETACGELITGANVENASYGCTTCAERSAVVTAVSAGHRNDWVCIAISGDNLDDYITPCGFCRQVIREFTDPKTFPVVLINGDASKVRVMTLEELLPLSFMVPAEHTTSL
ncbi:HBR135Wp [Eremothecium sinecaudum]|uniref:Cytidine deaminase n=1 Tax=Eremothecium sinecaudum TaxID=45286 RepID=A0A120K167_9SACH|nr:HBR135Wp [Eremothecium sinecaudum]AMD19036.1 HBR135Wp [Eremothecium sinecaudum]